MKRPHVKKTDRGTTIYLTPGQTELVKHCLCATCVAIEAKHILPGNTVTALDRGALTLAEKLLAQL